MKLLKYVLIYGCEKLSFLISFKNLSFHTTFHYCVFQTISFVWRIVHIFCILKRYLP